MTVLPSFLPSLPLPHPAPLAPHPKLILVGVHRLCINVLRLILSLSFITPTQPPTPSVGFSLQSANLELAHPAALSSPLLGRSVRVPGKGGPCGGPLGGKARRAQEVASGQSTARGRSPGSLSQPVWLNCVSGAHTSPLPRYRQPAASFNLREEALLAESASSIPAAVGLSPGAASASLPACLPISLFLSFPPSLPS